MDLPDYETVTKEPLEKDSKPPPYNFVTSHSNDFGLDINIPNAPPQYRSRSNTEVTATPNAPV